MGHFSVKIIAPNGSNLNGNQQSDDRFISKRTDRDVDPRHRSAEHGFIRDIVGFVRRGQRGFQSVEESGFPKSGKRLQQRRSESGEYRLVSIHRQYLRSDEQLVSQCGHLNPIRDSLKRRPTSDMPTIYGRHITFCNPPIV